jgi:hypothetical protein
MNRIVAIGILAGLTWSPISSAQLNGTLFSNSEERAYLDVLRSNFLAERLARGFDIQESDIVIPQIEEAAGTETAPEGPVYYTLGGIMNRRDGSRRIWLNNRALEENQLPANARVVSNNGLLVLQFPTANGTRILRPGQTLELNTGSVVENYQRIQAETTTAQQSQAVAQGTDTPAESNVPSAATPTTSQTTDTQAASDEEDLDTAISNLPPELMNNPAALAEIINILSSRADRLEDDREREEEGDEEAR